MSKSARPRGPGPDMTTQLPTDPNMLRKKSEYNIGFQYVGSLKKDLQVFCAIFPTQNRAPGRSYSLISVIRPHGSLCGLCSPLADWA